MNDEIIPLEDDIYEEEIEVEEETSVMNAMWGNISGNIENQTDLQQALDAKQDNLTQAQLDAVNSGITSAKVATYDGYPAQIASAVSSEADIRRQADTTLQGNIDAEESARKAADKDIQDVLDGETLARQNADNALGGRIDTEIHDRQVADNGLQSQIDAITSKSDVVDVVANYAALQAYDTSTLGNNDVVKVLDDETHGDAMTYYRWSTTTQTWSYIGQEAPYYTKSQTDTLLLDKQDKIDSTHKLSADLVDDTSTTNKFVTAQDKTNWNAKQNALTAGNNIDITGTTISTPAIAPEVVAELPTTGAEGKLYLTPKNYTRGTGTGNPITATITDEAGKMDSFKLDGDTFQQTYTGKNLVGATEQEYTNQGVTTTMNSDGTITSKGTCAQTYFGITRQTSGGGIAQATPCNIPAGTYIASLTKATNQFGVTVRLYYSTGSTDYIQTVITKGNTSSATVTLERPATMFYIWGSSTTVGQEIDETIGIQLESGSTATTFERFTGGVPSPNPDYPQPIQTVTGEQTVNIVGKNKFNQADTRQRGYINDTGEITSSNYSVAYVEYYPVEPEHDYTISYNIVKSGSSVRYIGFYDSSFSFISRTEASEASAFTFSTPANTRYLRVSFRHASGMDASTFLTDYINNIQIEAGTTATAYTPYHVTSYPINLGKNLFDNTGWRQGQYNNGEWTDNLVTRATTPLIPIEPTTYTISLNSESLDTSFININYFDSSKNWLGNRSTLGLPAFGTVSREQTFTLPRGASYLAISLRPYGEDGANIQNLAQSSLLMLEKGSSKTSYAPYKTPIELCKLGTYQDYIWKDGEEWKVHKATATYTLNGTESWSETSTGVPYTTVITDYALSGNTPMSEYFIGATNRAQAATLPDNNIGFNDTSSAVRLWVKYLDKWSSGASVATWLAQNPATIYYALRSASQTDTTITDTDLIAQLEAIRTASLENGTNTITNTAAGSNLAGDMEIGYYGYNPTNRYDKFIWLDLNNNYEQIGS